MGEAVILEPSLNHYELNFQSSAPELCQNQYQNSSSSNQDETTMSKPVCRQFWRAGNYEQTLASDSQIQNNTNHLHIHPRFLHSNATSHKWVFGAVAELLDNAVDEIHNGATFVTVDKISNPRDGTPALLIQDDGSGMDRDVIRKCVSFGFSHKKSKSAIGQYGNGFKTSTMRLGADVIVFSRHMSNRTVTQSVGLLSYTYMMRTGLERIVVPLVDYELNELTGKFEHLRDYAAEHIEYNLSILLKWSPYLTEAELLKQFDDIGDHGTKIVIYNLWETNGGSMELDFETDPEDIILHNLKSETTTHQAHIAKKYRYSLRVYLSILYLRIPETFKILLRGKDVMLHNPADDLKFIEFILYKPQMVETAESRVITTIGFLKEAPQVNIHGFNVYHKNRLILPFWRVVSFSNGKGRGVVGVLEANFVQPTHNKQDFEHTSLFQKLELRLKQMTCEYWDLHCGLIGYTVKRRIFSQNSSADALKRVNHTPLLLDSGPVPLLPDSGPDPLLPDSGPDPLLPDSGPDPLLPDSGPDPLLPDSGPDPLLPDSGPDPLLTDSDPEPLLAGSDPEPLLPDSSPDPLLLDSGPDVCPENIIQPKVSGMKRVPSDISEPESAIIKRRPVVGSDVDAGRSAYIQAAATNQPIIIGGLLEVNKKLSEKMKQQEKMVEALNEKVAGLKAELTNAQHEYAKMFDELKLLDLVKDEKIKGSKLNVQNPPGSPGRYNNNI